MPRSFREFLPLGPARVAARQGGDIRRASLLPVALEPLEGRRLLSAVDPTNSDGPVIVTDVQPLSEGAVIAVRGNGTVIASADATPSRTDFTDFAFAGVTGSDQVTRTYTIANTGTGALNLGTSPAVTITGANASDFTVSVSPTSDPINPSGTTTFTITFDPSAAGLRSATVNIASDDANTPTYTFAIQGTGVDTTALAQDLQIATLTTGNGTTVANGGALKVNYTGYLRTGSVFDSNTNPNSGFSFTIGIGSVIQGWEQGLVGAKVGETRLLIIPAALAYGSSTRTGIPANSDLIFEVTILSVTNPAIVVKGNNATITTGDTTPSRTDFTDFAYAGVAGSDSVTRTYTINNTGGGRLIMGSPAISITGANAADFSVTTQPSSTVNAGSSTTFVVTFNPTASGLRNATVTINSSDPTSPAFTFDITGTGADTTALANDLQIATITDANGTLVTNGAALKVNYTGYLRTGSVFDSNTNPESGFAFTIGIGTVIQGWEKGLIGAKVGQTRLLIIPAALAYGSTPKTGIPANSDLIFEVTILSVEVPRLEVRGNGNVITNNDSTPSVADNTDLGGAVAGGSFGATRTFTITNTSGKGDLFPAGGGSTVSGTNSLDFSVTQPEKGTDGSYTFTVIFKPVSNALGQRTATISIPNADPDKNPFTFDVTGLGVTTATATIADAAINEGQQGDQAVLAFRVTINAPVGSTVRIAYNFASGTAKSGSDFTATSDTLTFFPGEVSKFIYATIKGDNKVEPTETFTANIVPLGGFPTSDAQAVGTITNDDFNVPSVKISHHGSPREDQPGDQSRSSFTISRTGSTVAALTVDLTYAGTAISGTDYQALPASVSFAAGVRKLSIPLLVTQDTLGEGPETVIANITAKPQSYRLKPSAASTTLSIVDDEPVASIKRVHKATEKNAATTGRGTYKVSLDRVATSAVTVSYSVAGTATSVTDFAALSGTVQIAAGSKFALITLTPVDDAIVEDPESVRLTLTPNAAAGYSVTSKLGKNVATIVILDNDRP